MATIIDKSKLNEALVGDNVLLGSFTRVKLENNMWKKDIKDADLAVSEKISKDEIQSMGFTLGSEVLNVDDLGAMGFVPVELDYGDLATTDNTFVDYGDLYAGSESDIDYGSLKID